MNLENYDAYALNQNRKYPKTQEPKDPNSARSDQLPNPPDAPPSVAEKLFRLAILLLALLCLAATRANACGPDFPNSLLESGDAALLRAPVARFRDELERMQLATSRFTAVIGTNDNYGADTVNAELDDLARALKLADVAPAEAEKICAAHRVQRQKLAHFLTRFDEWAGSGHRVHDENGGHDVSPAEPAPKFDGVSGGPGLPAEFSDYLEGAAAWRNPADEKKAAARTAWERLLARPEAERKYKSTWAAYMLGKFWEEEDADKAIHYFQQVRQLARDGFADSTGLAAASLGWEARLLFHAKKYREAIALYLEQLATGDNSAVESLRWVANAALSEPELLPELARDERAQKVLTAALIATGDFAGPTHPLEGEGGETISANWLKAVEAAGVTDVDSAEKLALAAYQAGDFAMAQRWIRRAKAAPVAQWLQAKLHLRAGKLAEGVALLAKVTARWPLAEDAPADPPAQLADSLGAAFENNHSGQPSAAQQVRAELGVLRLQRHEFTPALDALLRADYWADAAYVAERVLTTDELKRYVDEHWPPAPDKAKISPGEDGEEAFSLVEAQREDIRHLLGRRLTRELRGGEARAYYPTNWQSQFDALVTQLTAGWDESRLPLDRAKALFAAAWITRTNGMELLGTELAPDYHIWDGSFEYGVTWETRAANEAEAILNVATTNEIQRAMEHGADPERRFHYRYQAAFLAARAARFRPDNSDETALMLCTAGSWLKDRDPVTADIFYKSLVRRCRKTALGAEADRLHWFPMLDADGKFAPRPPSPIEQMEFSLDEDEPAEDDGEVTSETERPPAQKRRGLNYTVEPGDTVSAIVRAVRQSGVSISVDDVLRANPGLVPTRMAAGDLLIIPLAPLPQEEAEIVSE